LSGGQKTLLNMAFVFSISKTNKSLFYIIDGSGIYFLIFS
jgi:chromosome segregation ATPase